MFTFFLLETIWHFSYVIHIILRHFILFLVLKHLYVLMERLFLVKGLKPLMQCGQVKESVYSTFQASLSVLLLVLMSPKQTRFWNPVSHYDCPLTEPVIAAIGRCYHLGPWGTAVHTVEHTEALMDPGCPHSIQYWILSNRYFRPGFGSLVWDYGKG